MPPPPLIGISSAHISNRFSDLLFVGIRSTYPNAVIRAGGIPTLIPLNEGDEDSLCGLFDRLDGILIPGGGDVDPAIYGADCSPFNDRIDPARDWVELRLVRWAVEADKPLLGICRGHQILNVALGGTLIQDIRDEVPDALRHDAPNEDRWFERIAHQVNVAEGSRLRDALGVDCVDVNSLHHQAVRQTAPSLRAAACAPDGIVEAVEHPGRRFIVGVQWHPEALFEQHAPSQRLFEAFIQAASS
jgi:putative glutamine amidotransferase